MYLYETKLVLIENTVHGQAKLNSSPWNDYVVHSIVYKLWLDDAGISFISSDAN